MHKVTPTLGDLTALYSNHIITVGNYRVLLENTF